MFETSLADSSEVTATSMKVEFTRLLVASGVDSDKALVAGTNSFIYSYTTSDTVAKHDATGGKGVQSIDLTKANSSGSGSSINFISVAIMLSALMIIFNM